MPRSAATAFAILLTAAACSSAPSVSTGASPAQSPSSAASASATATESPSPSALPSPVGPAATLFVLVDRANGGDPSHYRVVILGLDGRVQKDFTPDEPTLDQSGQSQSSPPLVSITSDRLYYLDGDTSVAYWSPDGSAGLATNLPGGPKTLVSFAVTPDDTRIAYAIFDYTSGGPKVSVSVRDLAGGNQVEIYAALGNPEWPVGWSQGNVVLAVGSDQVSQATNPNNPFAAPNPYNATNGYQVVSPTDGHVVDTIPSQCAYGLLVAYGSPCFHPGGVGVRTWDGTTTWYANSGEAGFGLREALSPTGTVAANSSPGSVGLFDNGTKIDFIPSIQGSAVPMGWVDSTHLVVKHFNGSSNVTIVDTAANTTINIALSFCGPTRPFIDCTALEMLGTL